MSLLYPAKVLMLEQVNARIPEPVTTPQARSFHHATSKGALILAKPHAIGDWSSSPSLEPSSYSAIEEYLELLSELPRLGYDSSL
jgi:hypothetical protein